MSLTHIISETPIDDIHHIGDFSKGSSFRKPVDRKIVTNPVVIKKLRNKFEHVEPHFDFFFVNSPEANRFTELGEVKYEWFYDNMPKTMKEIERLENEGKSTFSQNDKNDKITIVFTNNKAAQHFPMTPWIIAHRLGHVFKNLPGWEYFENSILEQAANALYIGYNIRIPIQRTKIFNDRKTQLILKYFYQAVGTMRSARNKDLRDWFEFSYELFAQYLITGKNSFNPLPDILKIGKSSFRLNDDEYERKYANLELENLAEVLEHQIPDVLGSAYNKYFVM